MEKMKICFFKIILALCVINAIRGPCKISGSEPMQTIGVEALAEGEVIPSLWLNNKKVLSFKHLENNKVKFKLHEITCSKKISLNEIEEHLFDLVDGDEENILSRDVREYRTARRELSSHQRLKARERDSHRANINGVEWVYDERENCVIYIVTGFMSDEERETFFTENLLYATIHNGKIYVAEFEVEKESSSCERELISQTMESISLSMESISLSF